MLFSMTGYGKAECDLASMVISIEIKSLNSKQLDITVRIPSFIRDREHEIRNMLGRELLRGNIDFGISQEIKSGSGLYSVNKEVAAAYIKQLEDLAGDLGMESTDRLIEVALRLPEAIRTEQSGLPEEEWETVREGIRQALKELQEFRKQEGLTMDRDMRTRIRNILLKLSEITPLEKERIPNIRSRITANLNDILQDHAADAGRFEQEMIFYLEKYDITEEKTRLKNHCEYFLENLEAEQPVGKKLGFIVQEIGREINTLGSKAYDSGIQHLVVEMKDELEKIKEQVLNVV